LRAIVVNNGRVALSPESRSYGCAPRLQELGWRVLHVTLEDLRARPSELLDRHRKWLGDLSASVATRAAIVA
jgi:hypothetical protein